jgi:hypothetical protein
MGGKQAQWMLPGPSILKQTETTGKFPTILGGALFFAFI